MKKRSKKKPNETGHFLKEKVAKSLPAGRQANALLLKFDAKVTS